MQGLLLFWLKSISEVWSWCWVTGSESNSSPRCSVGFRFGLCAGQYIIYIKVSTYFCIPFSECLSWYLYIRSEGDSWFFGGLPDGEAWPSAGLSLGAILSPALTASYDALRRVFGSRLGLGGGCFRGEERFPPFPSSVECGADWRAALIDVPMLECTKLSITRGRGTELERKCRSGRFPPRPATSLTLPIFSTTLNKRMNGWIIQQI